MAQPLSLGRGAAWALLLAGLGVARMVAQAPVTQQTSASLSGRVLDGATGQPVIGAQVMLDPTGSQGMRGTGERFDNRTGRTVMTDAEGAWTFSDIAPGSHRVEASKAGYRPGFAGAMTALTGSAEGLQVSASERRTGIVMRMWRTVAVSGKVKLGSGGPLVRASITAMRASSACGVERLGLGEMTTSDDTGAYRFFDLAPGDYVISTTTVRGSTMASGVYHTTYYPGTLDAAQSRVVSLRGGEEQIDVDLVVPNTGFPINGRVLLADGSPAADKWAVDLWPNSPRPVVDRPVARTFTDSAGHFQFQNLPAGRYLARVVQLPSAPKDGIQQTAFGFVMLSSNQGRPLPPMTDEATWWGEVPVEVTDRAAEATLRLQEGWRIQGRVTFDVAKDPPPPASFESMPVLTFRSDGSSIGGFGVSYQAGRVETGGRFTTLQFPPGRYLLMLMLNLPSPTQAPTGLSLEAIRAGGRDVTGSAIELNGSSVTDVTVTFTDRGPAISGTVDAGPEIVTIGARLYVFPTDERYWADCGSGGPRLRWVNVGADGQFKVGSLPPGEYFVAATIGAEDNWIKTDFLRSLVPFATRVKLELGDKPSINLKARPRK